MEYMIYALLFLLGIVLGYILTIKRYSNKINDIIESILLFAKSEEILTEDKEKYYRNEFLRKSDFINNKEEQISKIVNKIKSKSSKNKQNNRGDTKNV